MSMHTVNEQIRDESKVGFFFIKLKLIKGYRYRYRFVWREYETLDENWHIRVENDGKKNNFIEIEDDNKTVADFISDQLEEGGQKNTLDEMMLQKTKSYNQNNVQFELQKKISTMNFPNGGVFYPKDESDDKTLK